MEDIDDRPEATSSEQAPCGILVVDDDPNVLKAVKRLLGRGEHELFSASGPAEALSILREHRVAVVVSDQMMPDMTGIELLTLVRQNWPATVCIMMTGCGDIRVAADAVNRQLVHYFIPKPWDNNNFRKLIDQAVEMYLKKKGDLDDGELLDASLRKQIVEQAGKAAFSLARAVDARDKHTHHHSERVAAFAQVVGRAMGLGKRALLELHIGGLLHDVGKIGVPDEVLLKPGRLTQEEFKTIKMHPVIGVSIVEPIEFPWNIAAIVRQHHENHDGSGYPTGMGGEAIILPARIIHIVDAYEAMSADRVYRPALAPEEIKKEILRCRGTQFDPKVTDIFLEELGKGSMIFKPSGTVVLPTIYMLGE